MTKTRKHTTQQQRDARRVDSMQAQHAAARKRTAQRDSKRARDDARDARDDNATQQQHDALNVYDRLQALRARVRYVLRIGRASATRFGLCVRDDVLLRDMLRDVSRAMRSKHDTRNLTNYCVVYSSSALRVVSCTQHVDWDAARSAAARADSRDSTLTRSAYAVQARDVDTACKRAAQHDALDFARCVAYSMERGQHTAAHDQMLMRTRDTRRACKCANTSATRTRAAVRSVCALARLASRSV